MRSVRIRFEHTWLANLRKPCASETDTESYYGKSHVAKETGYSGRSEGRTHEARPEVISCLAAVSGTQRSVLKRKCGLAHTHDLVVFARIRPPSVRRLPSCSVRDKRRADRLRSLDRQPARGYWEPTKQKSRPNRSESPSTFKENRSKSASAWAGGKPRNSTV